MVPHLYFRQELLKIQHQLHLNGENPDAAKVAVGQVLTTMIDMLNRSLREQGVV